MKKNLECCEHDYPMNSNCPFCEVNELENVIYNLLKLCSSWKQIQNLTCLPDKECKDIESLFLRECFMEGVCPDCCDHGGTDEELYTPDSLINGYCENHDLESLLKNNRILNKGKGAYILDLYNAIITGNKHKEILRKENRLTLNHMEAISEEKHKIWNKIFDMWQQMDEEERKDIISCKDNYAETNTDQDQFCIA